MKNENQVEKDKKIAENKFLIFTVGEELFGTPLLAVREVVEIQKIKEIPNTVNYFLGVINIRGEIVGVCDLRIRFDQPITKSSSQAMIVFESAVGPIAAIVDKIDSVNSIAEEHIDRSPTIKSSIPLEYLLGIGRLNNSLITLITFNDAIGALA